MHYLGCPDAPEVLGRPGYETTMDLEAQRDSHPGSSLHIEGVIRMELSGRTCVSGAAVLKIWWLGRSGD